MAVGPLATAAVDVVANVDRFEPDLRRQMNDAVSRISSETDKRFERAGTSGGKKFADAAGKAAASGKGFDQARVGIEKLESAVRKAADAQLSASSQVQSAERRLQSVREASRLAANDVLAAEKNLANIRKTEDADKIAAAEQRLAKARLSAQNRADAIVSTENALAAARRRLASSTTDAGLAQQALGRAIETAGRNTRKEASKAGDDSGGFFRRAFQTAAARGIGRGLFATVAAGFGALLTSASPLGTIFSGATASLVALTAAIGQAAGASIAFGGVLGSVGLAVGALVVGFQGMGDAMKATTKAQQELATTGKVSASTQKQLDAALKSLAPSARAVVKEVVALGPAWKAVQQSVQQRLFTGVAASLRSLAVTYLPLLRTQLGAAATSLSLFGNSLVKFLTAPGQKNQIENIFAGLNVVLPKLLSSVQPLIHGFLQLFQASLPFAVRLAGVIQSLAQRFSDWADAITKSGDFRNFMNGAFIAASQLLGLLKNIGSIIGSVFGAGAVAGAGLLTVLQNVTGQLAEFLKSTQGQQALAGFFGSIAAAGQILSNAFRALQPALQGVGALFQAITPALRALGTALQPVIAAFSVQLGAALAQLGPVIASLVTALTPLVVQIGTTLVQAFATLAPLVIQLLQGLTPLVGLLAGALAQSLAAIVPLFVQLQPVLAQFVAALVAGLTPVIQALVPLLPQLVTAVVQIAAAFIQLLPSLLPLIPALAQSSLAMAQLLVALSPLIPVIVQVAQAFASVLGPALAFIIPGIINMINTISRIIGVAASVIGAIARLAGSIISNFGRIYSTVVGYVAQIVSFISSNFGRLTGIVSSIFSALVGLVTGNMGRFVSAIKSGISNAVGLFRSLPSQFTGALSGLAGSLASAGRDAIQGLINGLTSGLGRVKDVASQIASTVSGAVSNLLKIGSPSKLMHQYGVWTGQGFVNGINQLVPAVQKVATKLAQGASTSVRRQVNSLSAAASRSAAVVTRTMGVIDAKLSAANDNLKKLTQQSAQYAQSIAQAIVRTGDIGQFQDRSFKGIVTSLQTAVTQASQFNKVLAQLKAAGLGPTALQQIADAGPAAGLELGKNILAAGKKGVDQINRLQSQLNRTANATGQTAANVLYGAGLRTAQGIVDGLKRQRSALDSQMVRLASVLAASLARVLGIKKLPGVNLPKLADGGMTRGPSIAGEAGRELVIPMTKPRRRDELIEKYLMRDRKPGGKTREINVPVTVAGLSKDETISELRSFFRNAFGISVGVSVAGGNL